jgi:hypothetical protein
MCSIYRNSISEGAPMKLNVFPGQGEDNAFGSGPNHRGQLFKDSTLFDVTTSYATASPASPMTSVTPE